MQVNVTLTFEVGEEPSAAAITYFIHQYAFAQPDDSRSPEEWVESAVSDCVQRDLLDEHFPDWLLTSTRVEVS